MSSIAERILQVRGKIKQGEFAAKIGVNPNTLRGYESGRVDPSFQFLVKICVDFSVSPGWLLFGHGEMRSASQGNTADTLDKKALYEARITELEKQVREKERTITVLTRALDDAQLEKKNEDEHEIPTNVLQYRNMGSGAQAMAQRKKMLPQKNEL